MKKKMSETIKLLSDLIHETIEHEELNERRRKRKKAKKTTKYHPDNITDLLADKIRDPLSWKAKIINAMSQEGGSVPDAAKDLAVSSRTLYRALHDPAFAKVDRKDLGRPAENDTDKND